VDSTAPDDLAAAVNLDVSLDEIESLINEVAAADADDEGSAPTSRKARRQKGPVPYDFRRPSKVSREHVRALHIVNETFARQLTTTLSTTLRAVTQVSLSGVDHLAYDEYVRSSPNPSFLVLLSLEPLSGVGLLQLPLNLAMAAVDRMLGGTGEGGQPTRALSDIESVLMRDLVQRVLGEFTYAYESLTRIEPAIVQLESNPQFAQITAPSEMVVVAAFDMRIGDEAGQATLCLPFTALQPVLESMTTHAMFAERGGVDAGAVDRALRERLSHVPVDVRVRFEPVTLTSGDILDLAVGDVLPLRHPVDVPLAVTVADRICSYAVPGSKGKRLACRIVPPTTSKDNA
jgi:flagellar motor switch protein FliM